MKKETEKKKKKKKKRWPKRGRRCAWIGDTSQTTPRALSKCSTVWLLTNHSARNANARHWPKATLSIRWARSTRFRAFSFPSLFPSSTSSIGGVSSLRTMISPGNTWIITNFTDHSFTFSFLLTISKTTKCLLSVLCVYVWWRARTKPPEYFKFKHGKRYKSLSSSHMCSRQHLHMLPLYSSNEPRPLKGCPIVINGHCYLILAILNGSETSFGIWNHLVFTVRIE